MTLQWLWFVLVGVLLTGYAVLDGFDLGAGVLYPFIAKTDAEKNLIRGSIGPVWDGNEVWLLTGGGALFAAFPAVYASTFSGFYLAIMLVLFGLILRAVSIEYRGRDAGFAKLWDAAFFVGSLLPALLVGVDASPVGPPGGERGQPRRLHQSDGRQRLSLGDVDRRPDAAGAPGSEPNRVAHVVSAAPDAVDPAEAQRRLDRLGPRHRRLPGAGLPEPDQQLRRRAVVLRQPVQKLRARREEDRAARGRRRH